MQGRKCSQGLDADQEAAPALTLQREDRATDLATAAHALARRGAIEPAGRGTALSARAVAQAHSHPGNGNWPLDSNPVENAIRPFVVGRRSWLFADSVGGANASANLYSLIETAKANGIEPYHYLVALFKRLPLAQTVDNNEALLPWNIDLESK